MSSFVKAVCPSCGKGIFVDPSEVPNGGKGVICSSCGTAFKVKLGKKDDDINHVRAAGLKKAGPVVAIEDSKFARTQIIETLSEDGIDVVGMETAEEGIQKIIELKPKVVIIDIFLGAGNPEGLDVIRTIKKGLNKEIPKDIKVIMYTVMSEDKIPLAIRKMVDSFIHKGPTALFHLREEVLRFLD